MRGPFLTRDDIQRQNERRAELGGGAGTWFSKDNVRFFSTTYPDGQTIWGGRYFITGERYSDDSKRLYSIRRAEDNGSISTVGEFQGYATAAAARKALKAIVEAEKEA
jgi:hypothetical protein